MDQIRCDDGQGPSLEKIGEMGKQQHHRARQRKPKELPEVEDHSLWREGVWGKEARVGRSVSRSVSQADKAKESPWHFATR